MPDRPDLRQRLAAALLRAAHAITHWLIGGHAYLSTGCLHGEHDYCKAMTGHAGAKRPARCKFCDARCVCPCHRGQPDPGPGGSEGGQP